MENQDHDDRQKGDTNCTAIELTIGEDILRLERKTGFDRGEIGTLLDISLISVDHAFLNGLRQTPDIAALLASHRSHAQSSGKLGDRDGGEGLRRDPPTDQRGPLSRLVEGGPREVSIPATDNLRPEIDEGLREGVVSINEARALRGLPDKDDVVTPDPPKKVRLPSKPKNPVAARPADPEIPAKLPPVPADTICQAAISAAAKVFMAPPEQVLRPTQKLPSRRDQGKQVLIRGPHQVAIWAAVTAGASIDQAARRFAVSAGKIEDAVEAVIKKRRSANLVEYVQRTARVLEAAKAAAP
jgi:hypothetical protein